MHSWWMRRGTTWRTRSRRPHSPPTSGYLFAVNVRMRPRVPAVTCPDVESAQHPIDAGPLAHIAGRACAWSREVAANLGIDAVHQNLDRRFARLGVVSPELAITISPPPVRMSVVGPSVTVTVKLKGSPSEFVKSPLSATFSSVHDVRDSHVGSVNVVGQLHVSRSRLAGLSRPSPICGAPPTAPLFEFAEKESFGLLLFGAASEITPTLIQHAALKSTGFPRERVIGMAGHSEKWLRQTAQKYGYHAENGTHVIEPLESYHGNLRLMKLTLTSAASTRP